MEHERNCEINHQPHFKFCRFIYDLISEPTSYLASLQKMGYLLDPGAQINIKMSSYQYRKSHCGDKTILRPSYLHNGISYTGKMTSLYWISPQFADLSHPDHS